MKGFTLIELVIVLGIGGAVVLIAHSVFAGVAHGGKALTAARQALDREANARRWLQATFLSLEVGQESNAPFEGQTDHLSFTSWERVAGGWHEPSAIHLGLASSAHQLIVVTDSAPALILYDSVMYLGFDYLLEPGYNSIWFRQWVSGVSAPVAVRMRITRKVDEGLRTDTLLFLIRERG